jgi:hypothetical protein
LILIFLWMKKIFSMYGLSYDWKWSFHLKLIVLWPKQFICIDIDHLITETVHFGWYWSSYDWKWWFLLILIVL